MGVLPVGTVRLPVVDIPIMHNRQHDPDVMKTTTLCLCMIVKNESHIILETLSSVRKYIDYWVICDTGSTDNTVDPVSYTHLTLPTSDLV